MAPKKALVQRWREEPSRSITAQIDKMLCDYAEAIRQLTSKAVQENDSFSIPKEWLPPFSTQWIFDLLTDLPFRDEVPNGRDLRGIPSICGNDDWDFEDTDFSFLTEDFVRFRESKLDGAVFDGAKARFEFFRGTLRDVRFRKVRFLEGTFFGLDGVNSCDFSAARLREVHFSEGADLRGSSFAGADLTWAILSKCDLRECDFRGATLCNAYIQEAIIDKTTDFRGANLRELHWQDRRDKAGNLFKRASDWRQGTYDSTTLQD